MGASFANAAAIAATQHGRITIEQLRDCEFSRRAVERAVEAGRLHRVHVGVYALGYVGEDRLGRWHGDVLACGEDAVLSIRCAATLMQIRDGVGRDTDITIPTASHRQRPGITIHRADLLDVETTTWSGIPVTSPARTMVDLAHHLRDADAIEWALREMQFRRLYDVPLLELSLQRRPNRILNALLEDIAPTGSPLEVAFRNRVANRHGLPQYECQARICGFHVDCAWPEAMLIVEVDGKNHDQPLMKRADAHRDAILTAAGYLVLRFRWADIHIHHERTAATIRNHWRLRHL